MTKEGAPYQDLTAAVEERLDQLMASCREDWLKHYDGRESGEKAGSSDLLDAMAYALSGGKRVRPLFLLLTVQGLSPERLEAPLSREVILDMASALEMVHAYSLVHDDLPAMDNDSMRRGRPSVHARFGESTAILAGDALLTLAFESGLAACFKEGEQGPSREDRAAALYILACCAGIRGMVGGQALDLQPQLLNQLSSLQLMVEKKTSQLFIAAVSMGAVLAGQRGELLKKLSRGAFHAGNAFQARDDWMDREKDRREGKKTILWGKEDKECQAYIQEESQKAIACFHSSASLGSLEDFTALLAGRSK